MLQEQFTVTAAFRQFGGQESVFLFRIYLSDKTFLRLEVEGHRVTLVLIAAHLEHWRAFQPLCRRVLYARGVNQTAVEHHVDFLALQVHVRIFHVGAAIEVGLSCSGDIGQRVVGRVLRRGVDTVLPLPVNTIECQRVVNHLIIFIDGQFQGVHRRRVTLHLRSGILTFLLDE